MAERPVLPEEDKSSRSESKDHLSEFERKKQRIEDDSTANREWFKKTLNKVLFGIMIAIGVPYLLWIFYSGFMSAYDDLSSTTADTEHAESTPSEPDTFSAPRKPRPKPTTGFYAPLPDGKRTTREADEEPRASVLPFASPIIVMRPGDPRWVPIPTYAGPSQLRVNVPDRICVRMINFNTGRTAVLCPSKPGLIDLSHGVNEMPQAVQALTPEETARYSGPDLAWRRYQMAFTRCPVNSPAPSGNTPRGNCS